MVIDKWERFIWGFCGLGLIVTTIFWPEGNYWDLIVVGLGFLYCMIAIYAKGK